MKERIIKKATRSLSKNKQKESGGEHRKKN